MTLTLDEHDAQTRQTQRRADRWLIAGTATGALIAVALAALARRQQLEQDAFAAEQGRGLALITALTKLANDGRELLAEDALFALARSPRPPLEGRMQRVLAHLRREDKV